MQKDCGEKKREKFLIIICVTIILIENLAKFAEQKKQKHITMIMANRLKFVGFVSNAIENGIKSTTAPNYWKENKIMDKDYIARNDALEIVKQTSGDYVAAFSMIKNLPSANVNEVVRCKDCKRMMRSGCITGYCCRYLGQLVSPNGYCCWGQRKESSKNR